MTNRFSLAAMTAMALTSALLIQTAQRPASTPTFLDAPWLSLLLRVAGIGLSFGFTGMSIFTFVKLIRFFSNLATQQGMMVEQFTAFKTEVAAGAKEAALRFEKHTEAVTLLLTQHTTDIAIMKDRMGMGAAGGEYRGEERRVRPHRRGDPEKRRIDDG